MKKYLIYIIVTFLLVFGGLTVFMGSSVLFDWFDIRAQNEDFIYFVVAGNVNCGILYLLAAIGLFLNKKWPSKLLFLAVIILIITSIGLYFHIQSGGAYMSKTPKAMAFRTGITLLLAFVTRGLIKNRG